MFFIFSVQINDERKDLRVEKNDESGDLYGEWKGKLDDLDTMIFDLLYIKEDKIIEIVLIDDFRKLENTIRENFIDKIKEYNSYLSECELGGIEPSFDDYNDQFISNSIRPYDPELIRVDPAQFSLKHIHEMMNVDEFGVIELDVAPDFQRNFVWTDITRRSRLIESLLLKIPLPMFYFTKDKDNKLQVVDGLQRLTVINSYLNNEFRLKNLEYLKGAEGKYFNKKFKTSEEKEKNNLDVKYIRRIRGTQISCNIIDPQTPIAVKFDIFKRINTGGKTLNPQEIRNCLTKPSIREYLMDMAESEEFKIATGGSLKSTRMDDQEMVLRFIAFSYFWNPIVKKKLIQPLEYKSKMHTFLDEVIEILNSENKETLMLIQESFYRAMNNAFHVFGKYSFRKTNISAFENGAKKPLLNRSLFIVVSVLFSMIPEEVVREQVEEMGLVYDLAHEFENNSILSLYLTNGSSDAERIDRTLREMYKFLKKNMIVDIDIEGKDEIC